MQVGSSWPSKDGTSFSADRLVSLAGGADDTWANTEDVTEEDFVLRSVWVTVGRSLGQEWLAGW